MSGLEQSKRIAVDEVLLVLGDEASIESGMQLLEENEWQAGKAIEGHFHKKSSMNLLAGEQ